MHLDDSEGDASFARDVIELMVHSDRAIVIDADVFSPSEYAGLIGRLRLFVASRLHSAIVATVAGVPSYVLYYVDKGRLYFEQLGLERYSAPIDSILGESAVDTIAAAIVRLDDEATAIRSHLAGQLSGMSRAIEQNFDEALAYLGDDDMATTRIH
jgi:polysaccharide pyruvyl transferase WcaK-like protein